MKAPSQEGRWPNILLYNICQGAPQGTKGNSQVSPQASGSCQGRHSPLWGGRHGAQMSGNVPLRPQHPNSTENPRNSGCLGRRWCLPSLSSRGLACRSQWGRGVTQPRTLMSAPGLWPQLWSGDRLRSRGRPQAPGAHIHPVHLVLLVSGLAEGTSALQMLCSAGLSSRPLPCPCLCPASFCPVTCLDLAGLWNQPAPPEAPMTPHPPLL